MTSIGQTGNYFKNKFSLAITYSRVSTQTQNNDNSMSLQTQRTQMSKFLLANKINITNINEFCDIGSGYRKDYTKLVNLKRAISFINDYKRGYGYNSNKMIIFIIYDISRFSRNVRNAMELLSILERNNVCIYSLIDQIWYNNEDFPMHKYHFMDKLISSEKYSYELSIKMSNSAKARVMRGDVLGRTPLGKESFRDGGVRKLRTSKSEVIQIQKILKYVHVNGYGDIENSSLKLRGKTIKPSTVKLLNERFGGSQIKKVINSRRNIRRRKTYENDIGIWDVSYLVDERDNNGTKEYLVRWKDYKEDADTWESEDRILSKDLITKYNNQFHVNDLSNELHNIDHEMDGDN
jgi:DNA invertase Pin-like site-specific DNA recombinase